MGGAWGTFDNDTLYHVRRVSRALEEGEARAVPAAFAVDGFDPRLDFPAGSPIPWPATYTRVLALALQPFAPNADAGTPVGQDRRSFVERGVGRSALAFSVLASLLAALVGWRLAGAPGALFAGATHALCWASIVYGRAGVGDHHAFASLLGCSLLATLGLGLGREGPLGGALEERARALRTGSVAGAVGGLALGAWVGSLVWIGLAQLVLAVAVFLHARRARPGLATLVLAFHATAALAVLPEVLASPWRAVDPWQVVNLSWFHEAYLVLGALLALPIALSARGDGILRRGLPWWLALALASIALVAGLLDLGPARGLREALDWVSREDRFMAGIQESRPLVAAGWGQAWKYLGWLAPLAPLAWLGGVRAALRGRLDVVPWLCATPLLALQAFGQVRFAEALALPLAVLLVTPFARPRALAADSVQHAARGPVLAALALGLALLGQAGTIRRAFTQAGMSEEQRATHLRAEIGRRMALDWLRRERGPRTDRPADGHGDTHGDDDSDSESDSDSDGELRAVMATWTHGHAIEWAADRPSIATNFGTYAGADGFRDSARFFVEEDPGVAEALLRRRRARYVYIDSAHPNSLVQSVRALWGEGPQPFGEPLGAADGERQPAFDLHGRWRRTMGARLMFDGRQAGAPDEPPLEFLRLVYVSPVEDPEPPVAWLGASCPMAWIWELVPGATLIADGAPGEVLEASVELRYGPAARRVSWSARASADADGVARLRVPYATSARGEGAPNGAGRVAGAPRWTMGGRSGPLVVPEELVLTGGTIRL